MRERKREHALIMRVSKSVHSMCERNVLFYRIEVFVIWYQCIVMWTCGRGVFATELQRSKNQGVCINSGSVFGIGVHSSLFRVEVSAPFCGFT